jgi:hypothetical protein
MTSERVIDMTSETMIDFVGIPNLRDIGFLGFLLVVCIEVSLQLEK